MALLSGTRLTDRIDRLFPREEAFRSALRGPDVASRVGLWLGLCFLVTLLTGVFSHFAQQASTAIPLPGRPVSLYRVTQTLHVAVGTAAVPLLLVKMWAVYPRAVRPPSAAAPAVVLHVLERLSSLRSSRARSSSWPRVWPTPRSGTRGGSVSARRTTRSAGSRSGRSWSTSP